MKMRIDLDGNESPLQLFNLGCALRAMSGIVQHEASIAAAMPVHAPVVPLSTTLDVVASNDPAPVAEEKPAPTTEKAPVTRKRRSKAEMEADAAAGVKGTSEGDGEPQAEPAPETPSVEPAPATEPESPAAEPAAPAVEPAAPASSVPSSGRVWTNAEVQDVAVNVARKFTPTFVTNMLAEYGSARINMLSQENLNEMADRLVAKLAEAQAA